MIAHTKNGRRMIPRIHETCKNHEITQKINPEKVTMDSKDPAFEIHIKCLKGHWLYETHPQCCEDYELTNEQYGWKLDIMNGLYESQKRIKL